MANRPHIIIFNPDEMGVTAMGNMGNPAAVTPFLDRMAREEAVDAAIERVKTWKEDKPLCIFLGLLYPHTPYGVEEPYFILKFIGPMADRYRDGLAARIADHCRGRDEEEAEDHNL